MTCFSGCIAQKAPQCGTPKLPQPRSPYKSIAPFVEATLTSFGRTITVGNNSDPASGNRAIIKSFEYGSSNDHKMSIVIADEEGGSFERWVDGLSKTLAKADEDYGQLEVKFGWIGMDSKGNARKIDETEFPITGVMTQLEVSFKNGVSVYTVTTGSMAMVLQAARHDDVYGSSETPMALKSAIRKLLVDVEPKYDPNNPVLYMRVNQNGVPEPVDWGFDGFGKEGPKCTWQVDKQNKLSTIMKWLTPFRTDKKKGIILNHSGVKKPSGGDKPQLLIFEDPTSAPDNRPKCTGDTIGTFIVNGGDCSNVIEFNPKINWWEALMKTKGSGAANSPAISTNDPETTKLDQKDDGTAKKPEFKLQADGGVQELVALQEAGIICHGTKEAVKKSKEAAEAHSKANSAVALTGAVIEAEMKIQGRPTPLVFVDGTFAQGKRIGIVFINPFHIRGSSGSKDWVAKPGCNDTLSSNEWQVMGIHHAISEGSYITTLKVRLDTPSINLEEGAAIAGTNKTVPNA